MLVAVVVAGTFGYVVLGLGAFDAFYQTVITVTTVGYGEIGGAGEIDTAYRVFTVFLVLGGVGSVLYTLGVLLESIVEGTLNDQIRRRRMEKHIDDMRDHVIVAGWGRVGNAIAQYVRRMDGAVVVIDRDPPHEEGEWPVVVGEATVDETLRAAGIDRAGTLVVALDSDADNLYVTLTARSMRSDLFVVVRTSSQTNEPKFLQAGADRVVNPHEIGGSRMAALAMQPHVAEFFDEVLHDEGHDVSINELHVPESSRLVGATLGSIGDAAHPLVVALRSPDGTYNTNPGPAASLSVGDVLIVLGTTDQVTHLRTRLGG